jgi:hypothetical protein
MLSDDIFYENYISVEIISRVIFISVFIKGLHGGVCRRECRYSIDFFSSRQKFGIIS